MTTRDLVSALAALRDRLLDAITAVGRGEYDEAAETLKQGSDDLRDTIEELRT